MARLSDFYRKEIVPGLIKEFGYANINQVPKLTKIVINLGLDAAVLHPQRALAIHPRIASALSEAGFGRVELTRAPLEEVLSTLHRLAAAPSLTPRMPA